MYTAVKSIYQCSWAVPSSRAMSPPLILNKGQRHRRKWVNLSHWRGGRFSSDLRTHRVSSCMHTQEHAPNVHHIAAFERQRWTHADTKDGQNKQCSNTHKHIQNHRHCTSRQTVVTYQTNRFWLLILLSISLSDSLSLSNTHTHTSRQTTHLWQLFHPRQASP